MALNLRKNVKSKEDALALMKIIKKAEKDIENGNVRKAEDVFADLRKRI